MASTCLVLLLLVLSNVVAAERLNDHFESQQEVAEVSIANVVRVQVSGVAALRNAHRIRN
jgi:ABC-type transporter Mla MlaB component